MTPEIDSQTGMRTHGGCVLIPGFELSGEGITDIFFNTTTEIPDSFLGTNRVAAHPSCGENDL